MRGGLAGVCDEQTPLIKIPPRSVINECLRAASMVNDPRPFNPPFSRGKPSPTYHPISIDPPAYFFRIQGQGTLSPVDAALDLLCQSSRGTF